MCVHVCAHTRNYVNEKRKIREIGRTDARKQVPVFLNVKTAPLHYLFFKAVNRVQITYESSLK